MTSSEMDEHYTHLNSPKHRHKYKHKLDKDKNHNNSKISWLILSITTITTGNSMMCEPLVSPIDGQLICPYRNPYKLFSDCKFSCNTGFRLVGSSSTRCQISGMWTHSIPECIRMSDVKFISYQKAPITPNFGFNSFFNRNNPGKMISFLNNAMQKDQFSGGQFKLPEYSPPPSPHSFSSQSLFSPKNAFLTQKPTAFLENESQQTKFQNTFQNEAELPKISLKSAFSKRKLIKQEISKNEIKFVFDQPFVGTVRVTPTFNISPTSGSQEKSITNSESISFNSLQPDTYYTIKFKDKKSTPFSGTSNYQVITNKENGEDVQILSENACKFNFKWKSHTSSEKVKIFVDSEQITDKWVSIKEYSLKLLPEKVHQLKIVTKSDAKGYTVIRNFETEIRPTSVQPVFEIENIRSSSAIFKWQSSGEVFGSLIDSSSGETIQNLDSDLSRNSLIGQFLLHGLTPNRRYQLTLQAENSECIIQSNTVSFNTGSLPPKVHVDRIDTSNIVITLDQEQVKTNVVSKFRVTVIEDVTEEVAIDTGVLPFFEEYEADGLRPNTEYTIEIVRISETYTTDAAKLKLKTLPAAPRILINELTDTRVTFSWDTVPYANIYDVKIVEDKPYGRIIYSFMIPAYTFTDQIVYELDPETKYLISVFAVLKSSVTQTEISKFKTLPSSPDLILNTVRSTAIKVQWERDFNSTLYTLGIQKRRNPESLKTFQLNSDVQIYQINGLNPATVYDIFIETEYSGTKVAKNWFHEVQTSPAPPELSASDIKSESFQIDWGRIIPVHHGLETKYSFAVFPPIRNYEKLEDRKYLFSGARTNYKYREFFNVRIRRENANYGFKRSFYSFLVIFE